MAYSSEEVERLAREWVDAVNSGTGPSGGWRLQLLRRRTRRDFSGYAPFFPHRRSADSAESGEARERQRNIDGDEVLVDANGDPVAYEPEDPTGEGPCDELPVRIRRFVPGCPWALADAVIRRLHGIAPYTGIMWNGVKVEGTYRPTRTELVRDEQSQSPGERGSLGTYTIVQDLLEVTACEDTLTVGSGDSCQASEETVYHWDADTVGGIPAGEGCEQGVTWSVRAVQRNEEGSFDYQVVKTVAKTTSWGPVEIECNAQYRTTERGWRNLYGEGTDASPWEARPCGGEAVPVDVPPECDSCGKRTTLQVQKNQDCTYDVVVRTREVVKPVVDGWTQGTSCRPETVTSVKNSCEEPVVPVPAPGERVTARIDRNDDDTWSSEIRVLSAEDELEYGWTDGPACRPRTVSVRENLRERPAIPSVRPGETMDASLTRTEDCLWNLRTSVTAAREPVVYDFTEGSRCRPVDVSIRQAQPSQPSPSEFAPGPGETVSATVSRNEDCTWDWRREVSHAQEAEDISWTEGSQCRPVESHSLVSQPSYAGLVPAPGRGERVSASVSRNADCTYDVQYRVTKPAADGTDAWSDGTCAQATRHALYTDVKSIVDPGPGGVGVAVSATWSRNEDCTYTGRVSATTSRGDSKSWDEGTGCRTTHAVAAWNQHGVGIPAPGRGQRVSASVSRNADCTYDYTYRVTDPAEPDANSEWTDGACAQKTRHRIYADVRSIVDPGPGEAGETVSASWTRNEDCTYTGRVSRTTSEGDRYEWAYDSNACGGRREVYVETAQRQMPGAGKHPARLGQTVSVAMSRNADCTYDARWEVAGSDADMYEWDDGTKCGLETNTKVYRNQRVGSPDALVPDPADGETVRASARRNDDCTYDVTVEKTTAKAMDTDWIEWESVERTPRMKTVRSHGYRAFRNLRNRPLPTGEHNWTAVHYEQNSDCTWSGHFAYDDLKEWKILQGADEGGIRENDEYTYKVEVRGANGAFLGYDEYQAPLISFIGTGNEGTETYWKTHGSVVLPGGARLGPRTYAKCVKVKHKGETEYKELAGDCDGHFDPPPEEP